MNDYTSAPEASPLSGHFKMCVHSAQIVAVFGVIQWTDAPNFLFNMKDHEYLAAVEHDIVSHINQDHANAIQLYETKLLSLDAGNWQMTGVDPEGVNLRNGDQVARLTFKSPIRDAEAARSALVYMVKVARQHRMGRKSDPNHRDPVDSADVRSMLPSS